MQLLNHAWIQPVAVITPRRNRHGRSGPQRGQRLQQKGTARHAVGVVITTDRQSLLFSAGTADALDRCSEIRELRARIRKCRWIEQIEGLLFGLDASPHQETTQR